MEKTEFVSKSLEYDIVVVGGGVSGIVSALAASRNGGKTILIQDRSVLGGNASSEGRVHIGGATEHGYHYDCRESGIIEEIRLEVAFMDPYNESTWIDTCLYTKCVEEPNLDVLLNTYIHTVNRDDTVNKIVEVIGNTQGSEQEVSIKGKIFIDGTGHGTIGYLAGAEFRFGREAKDEFNETLAPEKSDLSILGASILFKAEDRGRGPIEFTPPSWANKFTQEKLDEIRKGIPAKSINHGKYWADDTAGWWWIELGGNPKDYHPIHDNGKLKHDLQAIVYGIWDYIKNKDPRENVRKRAESFEITWIGWKHED